MLGSQSVRTSSKIANKRKTARRERVSRACNHLFKYLNPTTTPLTSWKTVYRVRMSNVNTTKVHLNWVSMYLARKYPLGTLFLRLLPEMGPPFYVVIRATCEGLGICRARQYLYFSVILRPWVLVRPQESNPRPIPLCSQALYRLS